MNKYIDILPEVAKALDAGKPVIAVESAILSHDMSWPGNLSYAAELDKTVRAEGAIAATTAIIDGRLKIGLTRSELELICSARNVGRVSRHEIPIYVSASRTGATTISSTMLIASMAGIRVSSTGGIGDIHKCTKVSMEASEDLQELASTQVAVVCSGARQIPDIRSTLEYLEAAGVPVIGNRTIEFPAFFCRGSGYKLDYAANDEHEIADILRVKWAMGIKGGVMVCNPIPMQFALDFDHMKSVFTAALEAAETAKISSKDMTPFMLSKINELTGGEAANINMQLTLNNARCAARIAAAL